MFPLLAHLETYKEDGNGYLQSENGLLKYELITHSKMESHIHEIIPQLKNPKLNFDTLRAYFGEGGGAQAGEAWPLLM